MSKILFLNRSVCTEKLFVHYLRSIFSLVNNGNSLARTQMEFGQRCQLKIVKSFISMSEILTGVLTSRPTFWVLDDLFLKMISALYQKQRKMLQSIEINNFCSNFSCLNHINVYLGCIYCETACIFSFLQFPLSVFHQF